MNEAKSYLVEECKNIKLYFLLREKKSKKVIITSTEIGKEVFESLSEFLQDGLSTAMEKEVVDYSPSKTFFNNKVEKIKFSKIKGNIEISSMLNKRKFDELSDYIQKEKIDGKEKNTLKNTYEMWGYCYIYEEKESKKKYLVFRKYKNSGILKQEKLGLFFDVDRIEKFESSIFILDREIDCYLEEDTLYILNKNNFEVLFDYTSEIESCAKIGYSIISDKVNIENEAFEKFCKQSGPVSRKLASIAMNKYYEKMDTSKINLIIEKHKLDIKYSIEGNLISVEKTTKGNKEFWEILKLFDDDYLHSNLTDNVYESENKS